MTFGSSSKEPVTISDRMAREAGPSCPPPPVIRDVLTCRDPRATAGSLHSQGLPGRLSAGVVAVAAEVAVACRSARPPDRPRRVDNCHGVARAYARYARFPGGKGVR
jgi:hypothetical protein